MKEYRKNYLFWRDSPLFDEETRAEVRALHSEGEIEDRFFKELSFGTGGMRGVLGAGTNRMNVYTVGKATQGLARHVLRSFQNPSAVIAYDSRKMSSEFALHSALILAANGVKVYLFESLRPTPELSFAVRELKASCGIVITASHNPPQYNGYKVYYSDGAQIVPPHDEQIIQSIAGVKSFDEIKKITKEEAERRGLLVFIGKEMDEKYINRLKSLLLSPKEREAFSKEIKIVYTPLNGTGNLPVRQILREMGFEKVYVVPEQEAPDGNFPTLKYPNPEDPLAFSLALKLAREKNADLVLATDPDADRLGVYAKDEKRGDYLPFTGNMSGLLILEYLLERRKALRLLPQKEGMGAIVTTIVSSKLTREIAKKYRLSLFEVLTGFKYIGEKIKEFEQSGEHAFEFGFEESYGCLAGDYARDKDAVAAVALLAEACCYYRSLGMSLSDKMRQMYLEYGYFQEGQLSLTLEGVEGAQKIKEMMAAFRACPPKQIAGRLCKKYLDLLKGEGDLPKSDVLYFELERGGWVCIRPSGTEPKIKIYFGVREKSEEAAEGERKKLEEELKKFFGFGDGQ